MQLYAFWRPAPMPFCITEPCNRLLDASHDPKEVIRQRCAGPLSDVVGQPVSAFGHSAGKAGKRIGIFRQDRRPFALRFPKTRAISQAPILRWVNCIAHEGEPGGFDREHDAVATVLIIGASRGIGLDTVKAALEAGIRCGRWRGQPEEFLLTTPN